MKEVILLQDKFTALFPWNQARIKFMALFVATLIDAQSAKLRRIALKYKGFAQVGFRYKKATFSFSLFL
jgi:hypothetical protein